MSIFDEINKAEVFGTGRYFEPGNFLVEINAVKYNEGFKGEFYIIECKILESDTEAMQPGAIASQVINLGRRETGPGNVKAFIAAALDKDPDDKDINFGDIAQKAIGEDNPFAGLKMRLNTFEKETKAGGKFTVHKWTKAE